MKKTQGEDKITGNNVYSIIGKNIKAIQTKMEITNKEFYDLCFPGENIQDGSKRNKISLLAKGEGLTLDKLIAIATHTGTPIAALFSETEKAYKASQQVTVKEAGQMLVNLLPSIDIKISSERPMDIQMDGFDMGFLESFQRVKDESGKDVLPPVLYARISPALQEKGYKVNAHKAAIDICRFIKELGELLDSDLTDKDKFIQYLVDRLSQAPIEKGASPDMVVGEIPQPEPQPPIDPNDPIPF